VNTRILPLLSLLLLGVLELPAQVTFIDGKRYVEYIYVSFKVEVVLLNSGSSTATSENIKAEFSKLKEHLSGFEPYSLEQSFPGSRWGDTLRTNSTGDLVRVPDLSQSFVLKFSQPTREDDVVKFLRSLPYVRGATGPADILFDDSPPN